MARPSRARPMSSPVATSGRVVFLRFLSQAYHPLRQVPPRGHHLEQRARSEAQSQEAHQFDTPPHHQPPRGATLQIREECERFFCETMKTVFQVEGNMAGNGSVLTGVQTPPTPPDDYFTPPSSYSSSVGSHMMMKHGAAGLCGWMEFWDYVGGASFRAFLADDGEEKSLFAFFDSGLIGRDLKQALIGLIELADPLDCSRVVICMERSIPEDDAKALMRSLQWVGFELTTLDHWSKDLDTTSSKWLFMGMEV
ncbi:ornithine decarboxylase antizyme [Apiospora kogelbergensis]|uniref:ornithine decarboxylase antizyme n=1 Tax=Apiospora kogelbergensis TaxID=1337665 RepID=UPI00312F6105